MLETDIPEEHQEDLETEQKPDDMENSVSDKRHVVGAIKNPDGTWDYSKAMVMFTDDESKEAQGKAKQREEIILGKVKLLIEANPNAYVDVDQARKFWGDLYDNAHPGSKLEMQVNEIYAQKYEKIALLAMERMKELEQKANSAETEEEVQEFLVKIIDERNFAIEMGEEAQHRRSYS